MWVWRSAKESGVTPVTYSDSTAAAQTKLVHSVGLNHQLLWPMQFVHSLIPYILPIPIITNFYLVTMTFKHSEPRAGP